MTPPAAGLQPLAVRYAMKSPKKTITKTITMMRRIETKIMRIFGIGMLRVLRMRITRIMRNMTTIGSLRKTKE